IPAAGVRSTVAALGMDPLDAQLRAVVFFDTPELTLNDAGVIVRARRIQGKRDDTVIKLRPVVPADLPEEMRQSPALGVEVDATPEGFVCSASMKGILGTTEVREAMQGDRPIRKLFTKEQRAFYAEHAPDGISLDDLHVLGPVFVLKVRFSPADYTRGRVVAELWLYPDGTRILELSTKSAPADALATAVDIRAYLERHGVDLGGDQQTKTKTALEFFVGELAQQA
ncbi:MAG TPA: hypothetical protein VF076_01920, partial [Acidimicrobiales bacterium]